MSPVSHQDKNKIILRHVNLLFTEKDYRRASTVLSNLAARRAEVRLNLVIGDIFIQLLQFFLRIFKILFC